MKLEDQVTPLQEAIRLKELGVKQESVWSWYISTWDDTPSLNRSGYHCPTCGHPRAPYFAEVAAFTADELAAMLPVSILIDGYNMLPALTRFDDEWICSYGAFSENKMTHFKSCSIAGAIALTLIHLIESKLITAAEVNARL